jgi:hypothetical protein
MTQSTQYICPICHGPVGVEIWLEQSEATGEGVTIEVCCSACSRRIRDTIHPVQYDLGRLVLELRNVDPHCQPPA